MAETEAERVLPDTPTNRHYTDYHHAWKIELNERANGWIWRVYHGHRMITWGVSPDVAMAWRDGHKSYKEQLEKEHRGN